MRKFNIPEYYRSNITGRLKYSRKESDPRKKDFSPTILNFGKVRIFLARHFGFCFGVENAIEISYKALEQNPDKRIYLLSQMIHNPEVNSDLKQKGIFFIMDTEGNQIIPWENVTKDNIVIIPAFGTTIEIMNLLKAKGIEVKKYNTTCPFVERVWTKSEKLGMDNFSIIIHGKHKHEETRATFSHSSLAAPSLIVKDLEETIALGEFILGKRPEELFYKMFSDRMSENFNFSKDLQRIGVVNQTTMLAKETEDIANYLRIILIQKYGEENISKHIADTRDTLCYATNDNQQATYELLKQQADIAIVVGGYNSSNTSHIVALCESKFSTYFINSEKELIDKDRIRHFNYLTGENIITSNYLPSKETINIVLTSGASCPDTLVDRVLIRLLSFCDGCYPLDEVMAKALMTR